jgi:hypothetical protein
MNMSAGHWFGLFILLFVAYVIGVKYPGPGNSILQGVGM